MPLAYWKRAVMCDGLSVSGQMFRLLSLEPGGTGQFKRLANVQLFKIFPGTQPETYATRDAEIPTLHIISFLKKI
jgi:hypothetical protein